MKAKTKLTKLWSILLAVVLVISMIPTVALATESATADFSDDPTTALALLNTYKNAGAEDSTWDSSTRTLTLKGVNFVTTASTAVKLPDNSTIVLNGDNTIKGGDAASGACYGIYAEGSLTISGSGTLNVTAGDAGGTGSNDRSCGIYTENALTMSNGIVKAYAGTSAKASLGIYSKGNFTISGTADVTGKGGTATGDGSFGINAEGEVIISGGEVKATGGTGRGSDGIYSGRSKVTINDGTVMAIGGAVTAGWSVGIFAYDAEYGSGTVTINGGTVTSAANSRASETIPFYSRVAGADIKTINFNSNGGSGKRMVAKISGETYILPENVFTLPAGKQFKCWSVDGTEKSVGDEITVSENITVTAVWKSDEYNVTVNGGTASVSQAAAGTTVTLTANTAPSGQVFDKWVAESGNVTFANANSETTTFTMPNSDVSVKATYTTPISSVAITGIDAPVSNTTLDIAAVCETTGVITTAPVVKWDKVDYEDKAVYGKAYTASITLTAGEGYTFADSVTATVNGSTATSVTKNADGTLTVTFKFPKTENHNIEITFNTAVCDGDAAKNPTINSGYEFEFCFFVEDTDKDGAFIDETTGEAVLDDKTLVVDKALVEEFAAQSEGRFTYESLMAELKSELGIDELKTEFTGGYDYSVFAYIDHSDGAYFDRDDDRKVTNAIVKVNGKDITDSCQVTSGLICIMPGDYVFTAAKTYTVSFDANGGSGEMTGADVVSGEYTLPANGFTAPEGKQFKCWSIDGTEKAVGDKITVAADTTVKAVWENIPATPTPTEYEILDGANGSWTQNSDGSLSFRGSGEFSEFVGVKVDGNLVDAKNYTVKEGSTIVTLNTDYLNTLTAGNHTLEIVWTDGSASTAFTVNAKAVAENETKSPQTGDNSMMALWIAVLFVSAIGVLGTAVFGKKKKNQVE